MLHNRHIIVERDGAQLAIAGTDDLTAAGFRDTGTNPTPRFPGCRPGHRWCWSRTSPKRSGRPPLRVSTCSCPAHPRRPDLAVPPDRPGRTGRAAGTFPARPAHPAVHHPWRRLLGTAVPGLRAQRDQPAHPAIGHRLLIRSNRPCRVRESSRFRMPSAAGSPSFSNIGLTNGFANFAAPSG